MVHNSCTTAVEAFVMEKPAIAYTPYKNEALDQNIPNPLSQQADTASEVVELVRRNLEEGGLGREPEKIELYKRHIRTEENRLAGDRIVDALERLDLPESTFTFRSYGLSGRLKTMTRKTRRRLRDLTGDQEFSYAYRMQKNPGMSFDEIVGFLESYRANLGRWDDVEVTQVDEDLFCFTRQ